MSYAMQGLGVPIAPYRGFGAYDPVAAPVFDGCTVNTTKGRTKWPPGWACNRQNFLTAHSANTASMPANATQTATNEHLVEFFNDLNSGKVKLPDFPSPQAAPPPPPPSPPTPPTTQPKLQDGPPEKPSLMLAATTGISPTVKYVAVGVGALIVVGLLLKKKKGAVK